MVNMHSELLDMFASEGREVLHPVVGISELRYLFGGNPQLRHDLVLVLDVFSFGVLGWRRELRRVSVGVQFVAEALGSGGDGHA